MGPGRCAAGHAPTVHAPRSRSATTTCRALGHQNRTVLVDQPRISKPRAMKPGAPDTISLLCDLDVFFAILTADRKRQSAQPRFGDLVAALEAQTVAALLKAHQRLVNLGRRFGLHLNEREFQIVLKVDLRVAKVRPRGPVVNLRREHYESCLSVRSATRADVR